MPVEGVGWKGEVGQKHGCEVAETEDTARCSGGEQREERGRGCDHGAARRTGGPEEWKEGKEGGGEMDCDQDLPTLCQQLDGQRVELDALWMENVRQGHDAPVSSRVLPLYLGVQLVCEGEVPRLLRHKSPGGPEEGLRRSDLLLVQKLGGKDKAGGEERRWRKTARWLGKKLRTKWGRDSSITLKISPGLLNRSA